MTLFATLPDQVGKSCLATTYMHTSSDLDPTALDLYSSFPDASSRLRLKNLAEKHRVVKRTDEFIATLENQIADEHSLMDDKPQPALFDTAMDSRGGQQNWGASKGGASRQAKVKNYGFRQHQ